MRVVLNILRQAMLFHSEESPEKIIFAGEKDSVAIRYIQLYNNVYSLTENTKPFAPSFGSGRIKMNIHAKMNEYNEYLFDISGNYTG